MIGVQMNHGSCLGPSTNLIRANRLRIADCVMCVHVQMTDKVENLLAAGVLDPAKVTRSGLMNACGIAGIMLTTQVLLYCLVASGLTPLLRVCIAQALVWHCQGLKMVLMMGDDYLCPPH